jgi:hypothetical protein
VYAFFKAEFNSQYNFLICIYTLIHITETRNLGHNKVIYSLLKFFSLISCKCSSVGSPGVELVKGKLSVQGFRGCQASGSLTMWCRLYTVDHPPGVPVLKVCYFSYCLWFAEKEAALQLNRGILGMRYWLELCISRNGPLVGWRG